MLFYECYGQEVHGAICLPIMEIGKIHIEDFVDGEI